MSRYVNTNDLTSRVHDHCDITKKKQKKKKLEERRERKFRRNKKKDK